MGKYKQKNMNKWFLLFLIFSYVVNNSVAQDKKYLTIEVWKNGLHKNFYGTNIDSITITPTPEKPITDPYNGYSFVDMGLPSGTLWASCNVGASDPLSGLWSEDLQAEIRASWRKSSGKRPGNRQDRNHVSESFFCS